MTEERVETFERYHELVKASVLPQFPNFEDNIVYPALGAADEAGEVAGKVKKLWRDHGITCNKQFNDPYISNEALNLKHKLLYEIGDVLWYLDALAHTLGSSLRECAVMNVIKLEGRRERCTSLGSGDDR